MPASDIKAYYNQGREQNRLFEGGGLLERARTQEIILRYLPQPPVTVLDVGGGAGVYALWLARLGYTVHLVDLMPLHIEQATAASAAQPDHPLASARVGHAGALDFTDSSVGTVLLLGPLYHLTERAERLAALREAYRVLQPGGLLFAATISRYASLFEGVMRGFLADPYFADILASTVLDGQHRNPAGQPGTFTTAYFHDPTEIGDEVVDAGFIDQTTLAVEGGAAFTAHIDTFWADDALRERLLALLRVIETEPTLLGATGHLLTVGRKPS